MLLSYHTKLNDIKLGNEREYIRCIKGSIVRRLAGYSYSHTYMTYIQTTGYAYV